MLILTIYHGSSDKVENILKSFPNPPKLELLFLWHLPILYSSPRIYAWNTNIITQTFGRSITVLCYSLNTLVSFDFSSFSKFTLRLYRISPSPYLPLQEATILHYLNMVLGCWVTFESVVVSNMVIL